MADLIAGYPARNRGEHQFVLKIRLRRGGAKKRPAYRIVVAEAAAPRDGAFKEIIGHYDPLVGASSLVFDEERYRDWLRKGAQPTPGLLRMLTRAGALPKVPRAAASGSAPTEAASGSETAAAE